MQTIVCARKWAFFDNEVFQVDVESRDHGLWWCRSLHRLMAQDHQLFDREEDALRAAVIGTRQDIDKLQAKLDALERRLPGN